MPNILHVVTSDPDELLNAGAYGAGAVIRVQTSATAGGVYADVSGAGATPTLAIVTEDGTYTAYDPNGVSTSWYRTRYENVGGTRTSAWSAVFQAGTRQLCSISQVKARVNPAGVADSVDDPLISELVDQVSDWIEHFTGRRFTPDDAATYVFSTEGGYVLRIPKGIRTVTSLSINSLSHQPDTGGTYTAVAAASILLRPSSGDLSSGWPPTEVRLSRATTLVFGTIENGATITGNFGFAATPPDVQAVCIDAVVAAYQNRKMGASGVVGAEGDAIVPWVSFFSSGSPQRATLERYRYIGMG